MAMAKEYATGKFGDKLRAWRKGRKFLQKEAAAWFDVPLETYRGWEWNRAQPHKGPSMADIVERMAATD